MLNNSGKIFEQDIKKSIPEWCWIYRFKDGTANFNGAKNENVRFQASNICDFMVMAENKLFLLELKTHIGASIPFSCIRKNQIEEMAKVNHDNIEAYFILNFRDFQRTYAVKAKALKEYIEGSERKSIPIKWCIENSLEISAIQKITRFKYNLETLLSRNNH
jgi:recombination protein U